MSARCGVRERRERKTLRERKIDKKSSVQDVKREFAS